HVTTSQSSYSSLFFYSTGNHLALHSFPTRRSSDLHPRGLRKSAERRPQFRPQGRRPDDDRHGLHPPLPPRHERAAASDGGRRPRSEEHTSELQSRGHLVCRLLLEKKKKQNTTRMYI